MYRPARDIDLLFFDFFCFQYSFCNVLKLKSSLLGMKSKRGRGDDYGFMRSFFDLFWLVWPSYQHHLLLLITLIVVLWS